MQPMRTQEALPLQLESAIERATEFLCDNQLSSGEIRCFYSTHPKMQENCVLERSPFLTTQVAYSMSYCDSPKGRTFRERASRFLLSEMRSGGVWHYWTAEHPYFKFAPPDLDDTACASIVLKQNGVPFPDNRSIFFCNRQRRGPFYTWIIPRLRDLMRLKFAYWRVVLKQNPIHRHYYYKLHEVASRADIDAVVNANVLFYLGNARATEHAAKFLADIVKAGREAGCDKWHHSKFNLYYSLSRLIAAGFESLEPVRELIKERILASAAPDGGFGESALDTALASCALLNLGTASEAVAKAVDALLLSQQDSGAWPKSFFYFGGREYGGPEKYYGWGSDELTTGFCLEALCRFKKLAGRDLQQVSA